MIAYTIFMTQEHTIHPVQTLPSGEVLTVHAYTIEGGAPGPTVYLQANLHGPEICGTAILIELLAVLKKQEHFSGKVIVVPTANPIGVNATAYNSMIGRFNIQSGNNWNRIFPTGISFSTHEEEKEYFTKKLLGQNNSSETRLSSTLRSLSTGAEYVLDIHTTGVSCAEHLFTFSWMHETFAPLGAPFHIEIPENDPAGVFDESHVLPFLNTLGKEKAPKVATWEVHHHGAIDRTTVATRLKQLQSWLEPLLGIRENNVSPSPVILKDGAHLNAPKGGYYSWHVRVGDTVKHQDVYASLYHPETGERTEVKADFPFILLGTYGVGAQAEGDQIAYVGLI